MSAGDDDLENVRAAIDAHGYVTVIAVIDQATKDALVLQAASMNVPPLIMEALREKGWSHLEMVAGVALQSGVTALSQDG